ncbi:MAG: hypothetical protein AAGG72_09155, partial [Pseudomonadota bacterium]
MSQQIPLPDTTGLTEPERKLVLDAHAGRPCDLGGQTVSASVLRDVIAEARVGWSIGAQTLRLVNAGVFGSLNLDGMSSAKRLQFDNVVFRADSGAEPSFTDHAQMTTFNAPAATDRDEPLNTTPVISAVDADLTAFSLRECRLLGSFTADGLSLREELIFKACQIIGWFQLEAVRATGGVCIYRCEVLADVTAAPVDDTTFTPTVSERAALAALNARGMIAGAGLLLDGTIVRGAVDLREVKLASGLSAIALSASEPPIANNDNGDEQSAAVLLTAAEITGSTDFSRSQLTGTLDLASAHIDGALLVSEARIEPEGDGDAPAIRATSAVIARGMSMADAQISGSIVANSAVIDGPLTFERSVIGSDNRGCSIDLSGSECRAALTMTKCKCVGVVRLDDLSVGQSATFQTSRFFGEQTALTIRGATISKDMCLDRCFLFGALDLGACHIGRSALLRGVTLKVDEGICCSFVGTEIKRNCDLTQQSKLQGGCDFSQANIGGRLDLSSAHIISSAIASRSNLQSNSLNDLDTPSPSSRHGTDTQPASPDDRIAIACVQAKASSIHFGNTAETRPRGIVDLRGLSVRRFDDATAAW